MRTSSDQVATEGNVRSFWLQSDSYARGNGILPFASEVKTRPGRKIPPTFGGLPRSWRQYQTERRRRVGKLLRWHQSIQLLGERPPDNAEHIHDR
ncbi:hypothetical protein RBSH_04412 [Rhodopirellula baltica SH28]|uniref:Uncharacterized protein n=1 Tax=Rhodopirellula baltica SH28 TaxID=993517 RepID=K5D199_RHOBT|nr:hypothetical protein RBSH_04412 [Rhodopirellula baltica SH28]